MEPIEEGMQVPVRGVRAAAYLVHGEGVPPKLTIGSLDIGGDLLLHLANNRDDGGPYDRVERVVAGFVALADKPYGPGDQTHCTGGETVRYGTLQKPREGTHRQEVAPGDGGEECSVWLVKTSDRRQGALVVPGIMDSFDLADNLTEDMVGRFTVQACLGGQMTAADEPCAPGWSLMVSPMETAPQPNAGAPRR